eukprot:50596-Eustigmatos_ZCMA.PRE.1
MLNVNVAHASDPRLACLLLGPICEAQHMRGSLDRGLRRPIPEGLQRLRLDLIALCANTPVCVVRVNAGPGEGTEAGKGTWEVCPAGGWIAICI